MARLVYLKEYIKQFYQKYADYLHPAMRFLFAFFSLWIVQRMFQYNSALDKPLIFLAIGVAQAYLPISILYYVVSILIMLNLWKVSLDIFVAFLILFLICYMGFVRIDGKYSFIIVLTPVLFFLKLEYLLPVLLGMTVGFGGVLPTVGGILIYFLSLYTLDASALLTTTSNSEIGIGIQRIVSLMTIDKKLLVMLVAFSLVIFITSLLYRMFHERAWLFSVIIGSVALALLLLSGRLIFELDYAIWRVFAEVMLGGGIAVVVQFFKGIGDVTRMEKTSFEDDEYIYFVKAVPKIKVAQTQRNVTDIRSAEKEERKQNSESKKQKKESENRKLENKKQKEESESRKLENKRQKEESENRKLENKRQKEESENRKLENKRQKEESENRKLENKRQKEESENRKLENKRQKEESENRKLESENKTESLKNEIAKE